MLLRAPACAWSAEAAYIVRNNGRLELTVSVATSRGVVEYDLDLTLVRLPSGGERPYLLCPGLATGGGCGRRVAKLYWPLLGGVPTFACRSCHQLAYRSSKERRMDLAKLRAQVLRPRKPLPTPEALQRRYDRLRARAAATLPAASDPAGTDLR